MVRFAIHTRFRNGKQEIALHIEEEPGENYEEQKRFVPIPEGKTFEQYLNGVKEMVYQHRQQGLGIEYKIINYSLN